MALCLLIWSVATGVAQGQLEPMWGIYGAIWWVPTRPSSAAARALDDGGSATIDIELAYFEFPVKTGIWGWWPGSGWR
jgi:hypothetical protein